MGAARNAYITVDRLGAPRSAGGICAALRDLPLVGQLIADGGAHGGKQVLPSAWFDDIAARGDPPAWSAGDFAAYLPGARYPANGRSMTAMDRCGSASAFMDNTVRRRRTVVGGCQGVVPGAAARRYAHSLDIAGRIGGTAHPGGLALAPNGREPRLLMARQPRRAVVMAHLHEAGRGHVIAPGVEVEETGIAIVAQALLVIPSRI
jgi:hypothetical protein